MTTPWRLAGAIDTLLKQVNLLVPHRRKDSDGGIGDAAHASRTSDHNPYIIVRGMGVVRAFDFTHAPETGFDAYAFAELMLKIKDSRVRYIISNYKIANGKSGPEPWTWQPYKVPPNKNPHNHHTHVSVTEKEDEFDDARRWDILGLEGEATAGAAATADFVTPPATLRRGSRGALVKQAQVALGMTKDEVDGFFGAHTETLLKGFQTAYHLPADGVCGPMTWALLASEPKVA